MLLFEDRLSRGRVINLQFNNVRAIYYLLYRPISRKKSKRERGGGREIYIYAARSNWERYNCQLQQKFMGYLLSGVDLDQFSKPLEAQRGLRKDPDHEYKRIGPRGTSVLCPVLCLYKR